MSEPARPSLIRPATPINRRSALIGTAGLLAQPALVGLLHAKPLPPAPTVWPQALQVPGGVARLSLGPAATRPVAQVRQGDADVPLRVVGDAIEWTAIVGIPLAATPGDAFITVLAESGGSDALEQVALDVRGIRWTATHAFQTLLEPAALLGIDNVGELGTDGAAICLLQRIANFAQSSLFLANEQTTGTEGGVQIGIGQTIVIDCQISRDRTLPEAKRIELGSLMAAHAISLNQAQHFDLLLFVLTADATSRHRLGAALVFGEQDEMIANR